MAIHEALYFTKEVRRLIVHASEEIDEEALRDQARRRDKKVCDSGFEKVQFGLTSIQEVIGNNGRLIQQTFFIL